MEMPDAAAAWFLIPVVPICLYVAWSDLSDMTIPNRAVYALAIVYIVLGPVLLPLETYLWHFGHLLVVLVLGMVLNAAGALGAGDAKFMAAAAPYIAVGDLSWLIFLFAAILLSGVAAHRIVRATPIRRLAPDWKSWETGKRFPMGFPLSGTLIAYLVVKASGG